jgi:hypothetical protein
MKFSEIVDYLNDGNFDIRDAEIFGGFENLLNLLSRRNLLSKLKIGVNSDSLHWENNYLLFLLKNNPNEFKEIMPTLVNDLNLIDGVMYFESDDLGIFSKLFYDTRNISRSTIESILTGEYHSDLYYTMDSIDLYNDIISELNPVNFNKLKSLILDQIKGIEIYPETSVLQEIVPEDSPLFIDEHNIDYVLNDNESVNYIFEYLPDLESELLHLYNVSYNHAYENELYNIVWESLSEYFVHNDIQWFFTQHSYTKNIPVQNFRMKIWNFEDNMEKYLTNTLGEPYESVSYMGSYLDCLHHILWNNDDMINIKYPDWADNDFVIKELNDLFSDYL